MAADAFVMGASSLSAAAAFLRENNTFADCTRSQFKAQTAPGGRSASIWAARRRREDRDSWRSDWVDFSHSVRSTQV